MACLFLDKCADYNIRCDDFMVQLRVLLDFSSIFL